jgi:hypothetical protein
VNGSFSVVNRSLSPRESSCPCEWGSMSIPVGLRWRDRERGGLVRL